tara:strand:- start:810 stop:1094 length:285 start_codon:yes stop_codon:yes gene_type:complete
MNTEVCICIPKIDETVNKKFIKTIFNQYNLGPIKKINVVYSKEKSNKLAFVYFSHLNSSENSTKIKQSLDADLDFKIMYDFPWFWKCYKAKDRN